MKNEIPYEDMVINDWKRKYGSGLKLMNNKVTLTPEECLSAIFIGLLRKHQTIKNNLKGTCCHSNNEYNYDFDLNGAAGELAYCKFKNYHWEASVNTFGKPDAGDNVQVRTTTHDKGRLPVRPGHDKDSDVFVLVVGKIPTFRIVGWMLGKDAKKEWWIDNPNKAEPGFFVPQFKLNPFVEE
jgi:hypothetical protein